MSEKTQATQNELLQKYNLFLEKMLEIPVDQQQIFKHMPKALEQLCPLLHTGQIEVAIDAPGTRIQPEGEHGTRLLYAAGAVDLTRAYEKEMATSDGGVVKFMAYHREGYRFTGQESFWLELLLGQLFVFCGRARIGSLLRQSLQTDIMTGLPNLNTFLQHGDRLIAQRRIASYDLIYFNIKNFKYINKMVPYQGGDAVMAQYAQKVNQFVQKEELIARLGGDNYVALIERRRIKKFLSFLSGMTVDITTPNGQTQTITLSAWCGIYEIEPTIGRISEGLMPVSVAQQAAKQLYRKDFCYFSQELAQQILYEKKVVMDFDQCLAKGEFVAYLQPKVSLKDGRICGAEALARWIHKDKLVSPADFIPMLEKDGSVCKLDFEILRQVCALLADWKKQGRKLVCISVNMSRWHLQSPDFVQQIMAVIRRYGVSPRYIEIELTETASYEEYSIMVAKINEMKKRGLKTSIDDFGTGYSSLTLLKQLDVDVLKLDRSFLWEMKSSEEDSKAQILIRNIIRMANEMKIQVLVEGVETTQQRDFLIENACSMAQGFLYAQPLRRDEFERRAFE